MHRMHVCSPTGILTACGMAVPYRKRSETEPAGMQLITAWWTTIAKAILARCSERGNS